MTTIILTIIGILLAAAAALMVIFYGGDAFNSGTVGAQANQVQNAGQNVISAIQMHKAELGVPPAVGDLVPLTTTANRPNGPFLDEAPALPNGVGAATIVAGTGNIRLYRVASIPANVCTRINTNLNVTLAPAANAAAAETASLTAAPKMGCIPVTGGPGIFYARA